MDLSRSNDVAYVCSRRGPQIRARTAFSRRAPAQPRDEEPIGEIAIGHQLEVASASLVREFRMLGAEVLRAERGVLGKKALEYRSSVVAKAAQLLDRVEMELAGQAPTS